MVSPLQGQSFPVARGVLRGLHYQWLRPQGKLVWVAREQVFDVAVDIRRGSPNFGKWFGAILSDETHNQMYIPPGFAHGFVALSQIADFMNKRTDFYHPQSEAGLRWDDPDLGVSWPKELLEEVKLSEKDLALPKLKEQKVEFLPEFPRV